MATAAIAQVLLTPEAREALAQRVLVAFTAAFAKLSEHKEDIAALWVEFENLGTGETIMGCATKTEFCEKVLGRTIRGVRYMLDGGNHKRTQETVSPVMSNIGESELELRAVVAFMQKHPEAWLEVYKSGGQCPWSVRAALDGMMLHGEWRSTEEQAYADLDRVRKVVPKPPEPLPEVPAPVSVVESVPAPTPVAEAAALCPDVSDILEEPEYAPAESQERKGETNGVPTLKDYAKAYEALPSEHRRIYEKTGELTRMLRTPAIHTAGCEYNGLLSEGKNEDRYNVTLWGLTEEQVRTIAKALNPTPTPVVEPDPTPDSEPEVEPDPTPESTPESTPECLSWLSTRLKKKASSYKVYKEGEELGFSLDDIALSAAQLGVDFSEEPWSIPEAETEAEFINRVLELAARYPIVDTGVIGGGLVASGYTNPPRTIDGVNVGEDEVSGGETSYDIKSKRKAEAAIARNFALKKRVDAALAKYRARARQNRSNAR